MFTVIGVYMPHFDGTSNQVALYSETLEDIQVIIDTNDPSPIMFLGDMNANMPKGQSLSRGWHRNHPYTSHSLLLYDFAHQNNLYICNFEFKQDFNYTYSKGHDKSYIDHVFYSKYAHGDISDCHILCLPDIVSDHLPLQTTVRMHVSNSVQPESESSLQDIMKYPRLDWTDSEQCGIYSINVSEIANVNLEDLDESCIYDKATAVHYVNKVCSKVKDTVHEAVKRVTAQNHSSPHRKCIRKHWWNSDCREARDRQRFWYRIWTSVSRPRTGHVYCCYKLAKKVYRTVCRSAVNRGIQHLYRQLDFYLRNKNMKKFWNLIRLSKSTTRSTENGISMKDLASYYGNKFSCSDRENTDLVKKAKISVNSYYNNIKDNVYYNVKVTKEKLLKYINKLHLGCAAGIDGVTAEHLKFAKSSRVIEVLCSMLTVCVQYGVVANSFAQGLLIPLLKKPNVDPTLPQNYRPIVISTTFSKVLEILILETCNEHEFHDLQFGFVESRGTSMAVALTHDVINYCTSNGSPVYVCALDAEGAFDAMPHSVMFSKIRNTVSPLCWRILVYWYSRIKVHIKWNGKMSSPIPIQKGTRQGGLSSPFLFNILYQELVTKLSNMPCGVAIDDVKYNVCCYADDLLLCSLTIKGLQQLINEANTYITEHGLRFNPLKTTCVTFGKCSYTRRWTLDGTVLQEANEVKHLGVILANDSHSHGESRMKAARRAFYSLQGAGLCQNGSSPYTAAHTYSVAVRPVLTYGLECVYQQKKTWHDIESLQGKFLKTALGLRQHCRSAPLLRALKVQSILKTVELAEINLLRSLFRSTSRASVFYKFLISKSFCNVSFKNKTLVSRVVLTCQKYDISLVKVLCDDRYFLDCKRELKVFNECGLTDTISYILSSEWPDLSLVHNLLSPF